jgi:hypothetical protein
MPAGVPTDEETVAEFRAHYLFSGNASESAKAVGIPERTGRDIAARLIEDSSFAEDRRRLRAIALDELVAMRMRIARGSLGRFEDEHGGIDVKTFGGDEGATVSITDKRHEYGKLVLEAEKNAQHLAKFEAEKSGEMKGDREVTIRVMPTAAASDGD